MMPRPPWRAIATAIRASVTVSIGEEISGTLTEIRLDTRVAVTAWDGVTSLSAGWSRTSSNVRPRVSNGWGTPAGLRSPGDGNTGYGLSRLNKETSWYSRAVQSAGRPVAAADCQATRRR